MASTKFDIASAALMLVGASPVSSFSASGTASQKALNLIYDSTLDNWLEIYNWHFATKTTLMSRIGTAPNTIWSAAYTAPTGMKSLQNVVSGSVGTPILYDRFENEIHCNAGAAEEVYAVHTYEPSVSEWPGFFVKIMEYALAQQLSISLVAKLDMAKVYGDMLDYQYRTAKATDSKQQTTKKLRTSGRGSIMAARRA